MGVKGFTSLASQVNYHFSFFFFFFFFLRCHVPRRGRMMGMCIGGIKGDDNMESTLPWAP